MNDNDLKCSHCERTFDQRSKLNTHIGFHLLVHLKINVDIINSTNILNSTNENSLKTTKYSHQGLGYKKRSKQLKFYNTKCEYCNRVCSTKHTLLTHLKIHIGERPYKCDQCEKSFADKTHLKTHKLKHEGRKKFKCDMCGKNFLLKGNLLMHIRGHLGDRPYSCHLCDKKFIRNDVLKKHLSNTHKK